MIVTIYQFSTEGKKELQVDPALPRDFELVRWIKVTLSMEGEYKEYGASKGL